MAGAKPLPPPCCDLMLHWVLHFERGPRECWWQTGVSAQSRAHRQRTSEAALSGLTAMGLKPWLPSCHQGVRVSSLLSWIQVHDDGLVVQCHKDHVKQVFTPPTSQMGELSLQVHMGLCTHLPSIGFCWWHLPRLASPMSSLRGFQPAQT